MTVHNANDVIDVLASATEDELVAVDGALNVSRATVLELVSHIEGFRKIARNDAASGFARVGKDSRDAAVNAWERMVLDASAVESETYEQFAQRIVEQISQLMAAVTENEPDHNGFAHALDYADGARKLLVLLREKVRRADREFKGGCTHPMEFIQFENGAGEQRYGHCCRCHGEVMSISLPDPGIDEQMT